MRQKVAQIVGVPTNNLIIYPFRYIGKRRFTFVRDKSHQTKHPAKGIAGACLLLLLA